MHNQQQHAQQFKDDWTASVHQFMREGKTGGINDDDGGMYLHGEDGTIRVGEDDRLRNPVEGGAGERGVKQMSPQDQYDFQAMYDSYQTPRGVMSQNGPQLMGAYASAMVG